MSMIRNTYVLVALVYGRKFSLIKISNFAGTGWERGKKRLKVEGCKKKVLVCNIPLEDRVNR